MYPGLFSLQGKTALVTGGTGVIGQMIAEGLLSAGAKVFITGRNEQKVQQTAAELTERTGSACESITADLATKAGVVALVDTFLAKGEGLDILINNAAAHKLTPLQDVEFDDWEKMMAPNVAAIFELTKRLLPVLKANACMESPARIINVGSSIVVDNNPYDSYVYASSKAVVHQLSKKLANELTPQHVNVNCISPNAFQSPMTDRYLTNSEFQTNEDIIAGVPIGRMGKKEDMAGLVIFLCSQASSFISGSLIFIDGGICVR